MFRFPASFGAVGGLAWYFIYHSLLCPHGQGTLTKHLMGYGIAGGIITGTLYNPGSFFYGSILGVFWGLAYAASYIRIHPGNLNFKF